MNNKKIVTLITANLLLCSLTPIAVNAQTGEQTYQTQENNIIDANEILNRTGIDESIYTPSDQNSVDKIEAQTMPTQEQHDFYTSARSISNINQYIIDKNYGNPVIEQQIKNFTRFNYADGYGKPRGVVIHETANDNSTITGEINYMTQNWENAFVHTFVDKDRIIQIHPTENAVWGAGAKANPYFVQFELVREKTQENFYKSVNNDAYYAAYILKQYGITPVNAHNTGIGTVWSHDAVSRFLGGTNHTDPVGYFNKWGYNFNQFFELIQQKYNELTVPVYKVYYAKSTISLRSTPNWNSSIVTTIPEGASVSIDLNSKTSEQFYKVTYQGKTGWMKLDYFSSTSVLEDNYAKSTINLRKSATWDSEIAVTIPTGEKVSLNNTTLTNGFYKITFNNQTGWMKKEYFSSAPVLETYYAKDIVNLRKNAMWDSPISITIPAGERITLNNSTLTNGFYQITYNNTTGWMKKDYFADQPTIELLYAKNEIYTRESPSWDSPTSFSIPEGGQVSLNNTTPVNGFYKITYGNSTAWMKKDYFSNKAVLVDYTASSTVNLRKDASWDSPVVKVVPNNATVVVNVTSSSNDFYKINYDGQVGWMKLSYFQISQ
ncbi:SH3 domain-containing protein [Listeria sp. SHR_NRA_18]|uniref:SH3 domain-containing protein n=1 Tax=Listeria sp. SHR_NRA_18 TaxID=2269046 RepID=UPI00051D78CB|nr:SH3 domain-containing protein [Listeria sp. SHR_NRA_18]KGL37738.1 autolysin [Listeriaceae bacterium FSL A5-0209]